MGCENRLEGEGYCVWRMRMICCVCLIEADNRREIEDVGTEVMETLMLLKGSLFDSRPPNVMISV